MAVAMEYANLLAEEQIELVEKAKLIRSQDDYVNFLQCCLKTSLKIR